MFMVPGGVGCTCTCACDEEWQQRVCLRQRQEERLLFRKWVGGRTEGKMSHLR